MTPALAIIGTAGRTGRDRLSLPLYTAVYHHALAQADAGGFVALRSGGAPWMDHLAVKLFLTRPKAFTLDLFFPCAWDEDKKRFHDTGERDWKVNPGGTLNYYHRLFGGALRFSPLAELEYVRGQPGVTFHVGFDFHQRNAAIVEGAARVIAYTWGEGAEPIDGGTKHAWDMTPAGVPKTHYPLAAFLPR